MKKSVLKRILSACDALVARRWTGGIPVDGVPIEPHSEGAVLRSGTGREQLSVTLRGAALASPRVVRLETLRERLNQAEGDEVDLAAWLAGDDGAGEANTCGSLDIGACVGRVTVGAEPFATAIRRGQPFVMNGSGSVGAMEHALIELRPGKLRLATTDGHRLAVTTAPAQGQAPRKARQLLIRPNVLAALMKLPLADEVQVAWFGGGAGELRSGDAELRWSAPQTGRWPDYERVIPDGGEKATLDAAKLAAFLDAAFKTRKSDDDRVVWIEFADDHALVRLGAGGQEIARETIPATVATRPFEIAFLARYLAEAIHAGDGAREVEMYVTDARHAVRIVFPGLDEYIHVLMPCGTKPPQAVPPVEAPSGRGAAQPGAQPGAPAKRVGSKRVGSLPSEAVEPPPERAPARTAEPPSGVLFSRQRMFWTHLVRRSGGVLTEPDLLQNTLGWKINRALAEEGKSGRKSGFATWPQWARICAELARRKAPVAEALGILNGITDAASASREIERLAAA